MDAKLLEFAHLLRENGVRVSPAEDIDSFAAIRLVGLSDRQLTKDVLRATMIKRAVDVGVFDELFDLYFSGLGEALKAATQRAQEAVGNDPAQFEDLLRRLEQLLAEQGQDLSEMAREWLRNDEARVEQRIREAIQEGQKGQGTNPTQAEGQMSHALAQTLGLAGLLQEIEAPSPRALSPDCDHILQALGEPRDGLSHPPHVVLGEVVKILLAERLESL